MASEIENELSNLKKEELRALALAIDPVQFAITLGIDPDPWQQELLLTEEKRVILNCSRQSGKSTLAAIIALHHALHDPGSLVLVLSPSQRQSGELFKKITEYYKLLGKPVESEIEQALSLQLTNKSRIVSLPGHEQTIRGFSGVSLLIIDEAAQVADETYYSVRPMLAVSQGRLILLSTPFGKRGFFYQACEKETGWWKKEITADHCPRISKEFLEEERVALGDWWFRQEYYATFSENMESFFSFDEIENAFSSEVKPLFTEDGELDIPLPDHPIRKGMEGLQWGI